MRLLSSPPPRRVAAMLLLIALAACSDSKNQAYIEKPVDDLYNKAMDALVDENYGTAAKTFDTVESQHPYSVWATKSQLMQVYALYEDGKYDDAIIAAYIALVDKVCPCVVLVHSQAGQFGQKVAQARPDKVKALVTQSAGAGRSGLFTDTAPAGAK